MPKGHSEGVRLQFYVLEEWVKEIDDYTREEGHPNVVAKRADSARELLRDGLRLWKKRRVDRTTEDDENLSRYS